MPGSRYEPFLVESRFARLFYLDLSACCVGTILSHFIKTKAWKILNLDSKMALGLVLKSFQASQERIVSHFIKTTQYPKIAGETEFFKAKQVNFIWNLHLPNLHLTRNSFEENNQFQNSHNVTKINILVEVVLFL